jgi:glycosyltransferase involved in cell wall biosynthesis
MQTQLIGKILQKYMNRIYEISSTDHKECDISVICCFHNSSKYIRDSLLSVCYQKSCSYELMLLDDASTDDSLKLVQDILYSSKIKFKLYKSETNIGVPAARNFLIQNSKGSLVAIHDSDDCMIPYRLAIQYNYMINNPYIDILGCHAIKIDDKDSFLGFMHYPPRDHDDIISMFCGKVNPMIDPTIMMKKSEFISLGLYSVMQKDRLAQDFDMWIRASMVGKKLGNIQIPLVSYRVNPDGLTQQKKDEMIKSHVHIQNKYRTYLESIRVKNVKK